jgi:hypothetical protein
MDQQSANTGRSSKINLLPLIYYGTLSRLIGDSCRNGLWVRTGRLLTQLRLCAGVSKFTVQYVDLQWHLPTLVPILYTKKTRPNTTNQISYFFKVRSVVLLRFFDLFRPLSTVLAKYGSIQFSSHHAVHPSQNNAWLSVSSESFGIYPEEHIWCNSCARPPFAGYPT